MNLKSRISKIESKLGENRPSEELGIPIIPLTTEQKSKWPKGRPYPILGGLSILSSYEMHKKIIQ